MSIRFKSTIETIKVVFRVTLATAWDAVARIAQVPLIYYCFFFLYSNLAFVILSLKPPSFTKAISNCLIC
jgi:hypothetical protein